MWFFQKEKSKIQKDFNDTKPLLNPEYYQKKELLVLHFDGEMSSEVPGTVLPGLSIHSAWDPSQLPNFQALA